MQENFLSDEENAKIWKMYQFAKEMNGRGDCTITISVKDNKKKLYLNETHTEAVRMGV